MPANIITALVSTGAGGAFAAAHARLLRDSTFQFAFERPPPVSTRPPAWLIDLLRLLGRPLAWLAPYAGWAVWGLLAAGVVAVVGAVAWGILRRGPGAAARTRARRGTPEAWRPDPARARVLLGDADRLAEEGRFADAARLLLHRSIADIDQRRPDLVAISDTSRDIAALDRLPAPARSAFALIAAHVEASLFALRALDAQAYAECRRAYADFALPAAWAGA